MSEAQTTPKAMSPELVRAALKGVRRFLKLDEASPDEIEAVCQIILKIDDIPANRRLRASFPALDVHVETSPTLKVEVELRKDP